MTTNSNWIGGNNRKIAILTRLPYAQKPPMAIGNRHMAMKK